MARGPLGRAVSPAAKQVRARPADQPSRPRATKTRRAHAPEAPRYSGRVATSSHRSSAGGSHGQASERDGSLIELTLDAPPAAQDTAERFAWSLGVQGLATRDADTGLEATRVQVVVWLPPDMDVDSITRAAHAALPGEDLRVSARASSVAWGMPSPRRLGRRFLVVPPGGAAPSRNRRELLRLDATLCFGDGAHPTTILCLEALERLYRRGTPRRVLDVGTGTGILAIAAARLGARRVVAVDIDPLSLHAARHHLALNGVGRRVSLGSKLPGGVFDLVVANLYLEPLLELAATLAARVASGGTLLVSGFTLSARADVTAALTAHGLRMRATTHREGWSCLRLVRHAVA
jgi:ribosomal protein L11 methylase PrmA